MARACQGHIGDRLELPVSGIVDFRARQSLVGGRPAAGDKHRAVGKEGGRMAEAARVHFSRSREALGTGVVELG